MGKMYGNCTSRSRDGSKVAKVDLYIAAFYDPWQLVFLRWEALENKLQANPNQRTPCKSRPPLGRAVLIGFQRLLDWPGFLHHRPGVDRIVHWKPTENSYTHVLWQHMCHLQPPFSITHCAVVNILHECRRSEGTSAPVGNALLLDCSLKNKK